MPSQSRSQRRRQQQARSRQRLPEPRRAPEAIEESPADEGATVDIIATPEREPVVPANAPRRQRRAVRPAPQPVDYTGDYQVARHDLQRIAILSTLLLIAIIALRLSGLV
ncbi:MAG: hypothetical protein HXY39_18810 [Chloroflexi bacterium]|nr:hypothetical protein [Chloroflexota bacterium]